MVVNSNATDKSYVQSFPMPSLANVQIKNEWIGRKGVGLLLQ